MPQRKPPAKPSIMQRAKATFNELANALDPVQQFGPAAQRRMKKEQGRGSSMIGRDAVKKRLDKTIDQQSMGNDPQARITRRGNGRRYS